MRASSGAALARATEFVRPDGRYTDQLAGDVLAEIAKTLWTESTAPNLAAAIGKVRGKPFSVRAAERYLGGQRDWSGDAIAAIVAEIMRRHGLRNVKVTKR